uniref:RING-type domain-containing protein n=1 Tax=Setaria digitata TaxID=48799 RepID=A0A915Q3X6_9BILA
MSMSMSTYYCHNCQQGVALRDGFKVEGFKDFVCARCGSEFIEELSTDNRSYVSPFGMIFGQMISDGTHGNAEVGSSSNAQQQEQNQQPSIRFMHGPSVVGGDDENIILLFLNQLLTNLSAQGAQIQLQITRDPNAHGNVLHGPVADYAWGEGGLDQIVTQLLNQFEGGSTPVDPKLLPNLPMTVVETKHVDSGAQCTTCMETFKKDESVAILECQHIFHRDCILPWLRRHNTCPICRQTVDATKWSSNNPLDELD